MASILSRIYQIFALLYATDDFFFRSTAKTSTTKLPPSLLISFSDFKLSNITELSESDLLMVALNISMETFDSFTLLFLKLSICQLANKFSFLAFLIFTFFLLDSTSDSIPDQTPASSPVSLSTSRCSKLQPCYSTLMFLLALPSSSANSKNLLAVFTARSPSPSFQLLFLLISLYIFYQVFLLSWYFIACNTVFLYRLSAGDLLLTLIPNIFILSNYEDIVCLPISLFQVLFLISF